MFDPLGDGISEILFIESCGNDESIVRAARVSYNNDRMAFSAQRDIGLIRYLIRHEHGSPLEHNMITFRIKAPLFVVQEMLRHRIGVSFNQESARYTELKPEFYVPAIFRKQSEKNKQASEGQLDDAEQTMAREHYLAAINQAYAAYQSLLHIGVPREQARGVLPHCTYTSLYVTFNLRSLMHFLELRLAAGAQWEIVQYAKAFLEVVEEHFPITISAWREFREIK